MARSSLPHQPVASCHEHIGATLSAGMRVNQRKHVGALREFNSEQIGFSIWRCNFINNIAAVQHQRTIFDNAHVLVSELQSISLNRRELERDQAAFPIWVFGGTDKTRTSRFSTPPYCRTIKLSHLRNATVLRHVDTTVQRRSNLTTGKAGLDQLIAIRTTSQW